MKTKKDDEIEINKNKEDKKIFIKIMMNSIEAKKILLPRIYLFYEKIKNNKYNIIDWNEKIIKLENKGIHHANHILLWNIKFMKWFINEQIIQNNKIFHFEHQCNLELGLTKCPVVSFDVNKKIYCHVKTTISYRSIDIFEDEYTKEPLEVHIIATKHYKPKDIDEALSLIIQAIIRCIREYDRIRFFDTKKEQIVFNHLEQYTKEYIKTNIVPLVNSHWIINKKIEVEKNEQLFPLGIGKVLVELPYILPFEIYLFYSCLNKEKKYFTIKDIEECLKIEMKDNWIGEDI